VDDKFKEDTVGEAFRRNGKCIEENPKERECLRELGVDDRLISKRTKWEGLRHVLIGPSVRKRDGLL
jgi:hypothetical protein